jgi:hypothetical protein
MGVNIDLRRRRNRITVLKVATKTMSKEISKGGVVRNYIGEVDISGTSLVGEINAPFKVMKAVFGAPVQNDGYKTDAEWHVMTPAGPATIYNYKDGKNYCGREGIATTKLTEWHIGGRDANVYAWVDLAILSYLMN